jgi:ATP synthase protein I
MVAGGTDGERRDMRRSIERDARRHARREPTAATFWRSLSVLGTVGWSIALPAAGGALLGHHLDARLGTGVHLTLILLTAGVMVGAVLAWHALGRGRR